MQHLMYFLCPLFLAYKMYRKATTDFSGLQIIFLILLFVLLKVNHEINLCVMLHVWWFYSVYPTEDT